jgi:hypothetical protein
MTPFGLGDTTQPIGTHPHVPAFANAGDVSPFSTGTYPHGMMRLRFTNDATGKPMAGAVSLVEMYVPVYFTQVIQGTTTVIAGVDSSLNMLQKPFPANCGAGGTACMNVSPVISRPCTSNAAGTIAGTTLTWGACAPPPNGMTTWNYANGQAAMGPGCATGFTQWGNTSCTGNLCALVNQAEFGDAFQAWNQAMATATFSSTTYDTATFTMPAVQIPNAAGIVTMISVTSSTIVTTQCGSTPGTDLVCNVQ